MRDFDLALDAYARGNVDVVSMIDSDANTVAKARVRFPEELKLFPIPSTFYLAFLADRPPFDDARVRKAFIHAIDREQLIRQASRGQYRPASGGFVPPGMPGHSAGIGLSFDPNLARRLLGTSGYGAGDQFPAVTLMTLRTGMDDPNVRFLSKAWHEHLGIDVIHEDVEWREFLRRRDQDPPHLSLSGWSADYPDPDSMLRLVFHSSEGVNPPRWKDERFDALVEEGARVLDQGERIQLYQEADRILVSEQAVILPIGYAQGRQLSKPWVRMPEATPQMVRLRDVILIKPDAEKEEE
jgi:oligopeptide transport system substrate-binding protein